MKHWILFTIRTVATVGLVVVTMSWAAGALGPAAITMRHSSLLLACQSDSETLAVQCFLNQLCLQKVIAPTAPEQLPSLVQQTVPARVVGDSLERFYDEGFEPAVPVTANTVSIRCPGVDAVFGSEAAILEASHWFLCLTFLIITIVTSVRWRKPTQTDSHDARQQSTIHRPVPVHED